MLNLRTLIKVLLGFNLGLNGMIHKFFQNRKSKIVHLAIAVLLVGCNHQEHSSKAKLKFEKGYSSNFLHKTLSPGTLYTTVLDTFGEPLDTVKRGEELLLTFISDASSTELADSQHFTGFQVVVSSNKVMHWMPVLSARQARLQPDSVDASVVADVQPRVRLTNTVPLEISIISDSRGRDEGSSPISIIALKSLQKEGPAEQGKQNVSVGLFDADSKKLYYVTRKNIGGALMFRLGEKVIAKVEVVVPIETKEFIIPIQESDITYANLKALVVKP